MEYSVIQVALVFVVTFIAAIDQLLFQLRFTSQSIQASILCQQVFLFRNTR